MTNLSILPNIKEQKRERILAALSKLQDKLPGGPDFTDQKISAEWVCFIEKHDDETIRFSINNAKNTLKFFPKTPHEFLKISEENNEMSAADKKEFEQQCNLLFEIAMERIITEGEKPSGISDVSCFWLYKNFKHIKEFTDYFKNVNYRHLRKKEMENEIKELYVKRRTDDGLRKTIENIALQLS